MNICRYEYEKMKKYNLNSGSIKIKIKIMIKICLKTEISLLFILAIIIRRQHRTVNRKRLLLHPKLFEGWPASVNTLSRIRTLIGSEKPYSPVLKLNSGLNKVRFSSE